MKRTRAGEGQLYLFSVPSTTIRNTSAPIPEPGKARGIRGRPVAEEHTLIVRRIADEATHTGRAWLASILLSYATGMPETAARLLVSRLHTLRTDYAVPDAVIFRVLNPPRRRGTT